MTDDKGRAKERLRKKLSKLHQANPKETTELKKTETEHKHTRQRLQDTKNQYYEILDALDDAAHIVNKDLKIVFLNNKLRLWNEGLGLQTEAIGHNLPEIYPFLPEEVYEEYRHVFETGDTVINEKTLEIDNREYFVDMRKIPITEAGSVSGVVTVIKDLTEIKQARGILTLEKNKLQSVIDSMEYGLTIQDREYNIIFQNKFLSNIFKNMGGKCYNVYEFSEHICEGCPVEMSFRDGLSHTTERRVFMPSGKTIIWENTATPIRDAEGDITACLEITRDITQRKQMEEDLQESQEYAKLLFHSSIVPQIVMDAETGHYTDCNEAAIKVYGYASRKEVLGKTPLDVSAPTQYDGSDSAVEAQNRIEDCRRDGSCIFEWRHQRPDGRIWDADVHMMPFQHREKTLMQFTLQDITERKNAEAALKEREKTLQAFFDAVHESMVLINTEGTVILSNVVGAQRLGKTVTELVGTCLYDYFPPDVARHRKEQYDKVVATGEEVYFQDTRLGRSFEQYCYPVFDKGKKVSGVTIFAHEITDRKRDEVALRESEQTLYRERDKLRTISENVPFGMALIDNNGTFTYLNPAFREMFGYRLTEIPDGRTWFRKAYPDEAYRHSVISSWIEDFSDLNPGESKNKTFTITCKNGKQKIVNFIPLRLLSGDYLMTCEDVTELKHLEAQLRQSQKMEAIGTLAGGVAHDFNNILTAVIGYGSLLQMQMEKENPLRVYVDQVLFSAQKAVGLTQSLLAFSRQQPINPAPLDINNIIKKTETLLKRLLTEDITLKTNLSHETITIMADTTQIDQILINLATNARDAMRHGGTLTIETKLVLLDDDFIRFHGFGMPGKYALISVTDTGIGMDATTQERIFDPFFTTKEAGKGTGLGLSTVYGIIKQHDGYINVHSEPDQGTTFNIYLHAVEAGIKNKKPPSPEIRGGKERILIAEDNADVRSFMKEILNKYGYTVIEAIDGEDAVNKFKDHKNIDLLILDSVMPKKNGRKVYDEICLIAPDIKALFTSGYTRDIVLDKGIKDKEIDFISKPLTLNNLLQKVRAVLDG